MSTKAQPDCSHSTSDNISIKQIIPAMSTPLASIFGSGFLVVVPVLASAVGPYALPAMVIVAIIAFSVCRNNRERFLCILIGAILLFVLIFAVPAG